MKELERPRKENIMEIENKQHTKKIESVADAYTFELKQTKGVQ